MFRSIKSKLIAITLAIFSIFSIAIMFLEVAERKEYKLSKIKSCDNNLEKSSKLLVFTIEQLESNVRSLSLSAASFYYYSSGNRAFLDLITKDNFKNNVLSSVGGGIWFEPYVINPRVKRYCSYASMSGKDTVLDYNCDKKEYNYLAKPWYLMVKDNFSAHDYKKVYWSAPYFDEIGIKDWMLTVGAPIYDRKFNFVGMVGEDWSLESIKSTLEKIKPTDNSLVVYANAKDDFIVTLTEQDSDVINYFVGKSLKTLEWYEGIKNNAQVISYNGERYVVYVKILKNDNVLIVRVPEKELFADQHINYDEILLSLIFAIISVFIIYHLLIRNINKPIDILVDATREIGKGNFKNKIYIKKPKEFAQLADTFNLMTTEIDEYLTNIKRLTDEKMAMISDLNIAKEIQYSSLPNVFPPFPDRHEIDLYATMTPAKEVGGDFYDFYFIDINHVVFTVADVSGKGVPAALFMMRAKSLLKSTSLGNTIIESVMEKVNNTIVSNNDKNYFVTIGMGVININTGDVIYINAGHNPPILKTSSEIKYLDVPKNIVVGFIEDMTFEAIKFKLNPLDTLFLYTDGVTEANNSSGELYGEERLVDVLNLSSGSPKSLISSVKNSLSDFVGETEQSDDITMLALTYLGGENFIENIQIPADISEVSVFMQWIEDLCDRCELDEANKSKVLICAEEIFVNIASYAYPGELKSKMTDTTVRFRYIKPLGEITLTFTDSGKKYNPLEKEDPDVTADVDERSKGGLGLFMVKSMMDEVSYQYVGKQNILTLKCYKKV